MMRVHSLFPVMKWDGRSCSEAESLCNFRCLFLPVLDGSAPQK